MSNEEFQKTVLKELKELKQDMAEVKQDITGLKQDVTELRQDFRRLEDKLDEMEVKNANRHLELEAKLNLLAEDQQSIKEVLGEHEVAIRSLRRRPV